MRVNLIINVVQTPNLSKSSPKSCSAKPSSLSLSRRAAAEKGDGVGEVEDEDESAARAGFPLCFAPREDDAGEVEVEVKRRPKAHQVLSLKIDIIFTMVFQYHLLICCC